MREPMSADLALSNIIDIAKERCNAEGHECDWECSLLDRSITVVTTPAAGMPHTPAPEMPRPAAQPLASGPQSVPGQSDKGTGVSGPENPAQADDAAITLWCALKPVRFVDDWVWQTDDIQPADVQHLADATKPAHLREAAASLRAYADAQRPLAPDSHAHKHLDGIIAAAERLESAARDEEER